MTNAFWDGFGHGFDAVGALRENYGKGKYARTGQLNALMAADPALASQLQAQQRQSAAYDQAQQTVAGRSGAMQAVLKGEGGGAYGKLVPGDLEGLNDIHQSVRDWSNAQIEKGKREAERMSGLLDSVASAGTPEQRYQAALAIAPQAGFWAEEVSHWTPDLFNDQSLRLHQIQAFGYGSVLDWELEQRKLEAERNRAPSGYRWNAGHSGLEFVPGGPGDPARAGGRGRATKARVSRGAQVNGVTVPGYGRSISPAGGGIDMSPGDQGFDNKKRVRLTRGLPEAVTGKTKSGATVSDW